MNLTVIGTGSSGNSYLLRSMTGEYLLIECGVKLCEIKQAINYNINNLVGVLISHAHL